MVVITAKANDNAKATCKVYVLPASKTEITTDVPTAGNAIGGGGTATDDGVQLNGSSNDYAAMNFEIPSTIKFDKCQSVKLTFALTDVNPDDIVKLTFAVIHKDAKSNYDTSMTDPKNGRIMETYSDITCGAAKQQDNITYDAKTGLYTTTYSLIGKSGLENAKYLMFARNGNASAPFTLTLKKVEYTVKEGPDALEGYSVTYPITDITKLGWSNWRRYTTNYYELDKKGCTIKDGEVTAPASEYDGIAVPLDNRDGKDEQTYKLSVKVKGEGKAGFSGSNTLDGISAFYDATMGYQYGNQYYAQVDLTNDYQDLVAYVTVAGGMFGEVRLKGTKDNGFTAKDIVVEKVDKLDPVADLSAGLSESFKAAPEKGKDYAFGYSNWDKKTNTYVSLVEKKAIKQEDGYAVINGAEYDGIAIPLDNRAGEEAKDFYVEATVKSVTDFAVKVGFSGSNTVQSSKYYPSSMKMYGNDYYLQRDVLGWQTMKVKITVPAGKFGETRLKGDSANMQFAVKDVKVVPYTDQDMTLDNTLVKLTLPAEKTAVLGKDLVLKLVASPEAAEISTAEWTSDDEEVATVANGTVTPLKEGVANITVKVGEISATCKVTVSASAEVVEDVVLVPTLDNSVVVNTTAELTANATKGVDVTFKVGDEYPELIITLAKPIDWTKYASVSVPKGFNVKLYIEGKSDNDAIAYYSNTADFSKKPGSETTFADGDKIAKIGVQCSTYGMTEEKLQEDTPLSVSEITFIAKEPSSGVSNLSVDLTQISGYDATKGGVVANISDSTKDWNQTSCIDLPGLGDGFDLQNYSKITVKTKTYVDDEVNTDISTNVVFTTDKSDWYNKRIADGSNSDITITEEMTEAPVAFVMQNSKGVKAGTIKSVITEITFVAK